MNSGFLLYSAFMFLCLIAPAAEAMVPIRLRGNPPLEVDIYAARLEYHRIHRLLAPHLPVAHDTITISFYRLHGGDSAGAASSLPEWGGGGAFGRGQIVVRVDRPLIVHASLQTTVVHELAHIALARLYPRVDIPRWFHEGVAMLTAGEISLSKTVILSWAIFANGLMELPAVDSVNAFGRHRAALAYFQSHAAVAMLVAWYGIDVLARILESARREGSFNRGMHETLGITGEEFDGLARQWIIRKYRFAFLFLDNYLLWSAVVGLFLLGYLLTIIRKRRRMRALAEEESRHEVETDLTDTTGKIM